MGRAPCCDKENVKKGPWSPEEDDKLKEYIDKNGTGGNWISLPQRAGLKRCGKSCRLRWLNYLRPNIKHGDFSDDEDRIICSLFASIGSRWSIIAAQLPGRTDNDIKNYWNTKLKKKLMGIMTPNSSHKRTQLLDTSSLTSSAYNTCSTIDQTNYYTTNMYSNIPQVVLQAQDHQGYMSNFMHMFGGDQASSSSSDGSSNNLQSYLNNGFQPNNVDQNPLIDCSSLEEIKQLISTNNLSNNFFVDHEIKTEEDKVTFY